MIRSLITRSASAVAGATVYAATQYNFAFAASCDPAGGNIANGAACAKPTGVNGNLDIGGLFGTVANVLIFLVGAISVIVLIIGGLRYVISAGNPAQVQGAKNTILYAIVGIVVAVAAYAIVQFVFGQLGVQNS